MMHSPPFFPAQPADCLRNSGQTMARASSAFQRRKIKFGYLFHSMRKTLCFAIATDGDDTWALEYRPDDSGGCKWHGDMFCASWWAAEHPAKGPPPEVEAIQPALTAAVVERYERMLKRNQSKA